MRRNRIFFSARKVGYQGRSLERDKIILLSEGLDDVACLSPDQSADQGRQKLSPGMCFGLWFFLS